MKSIPSNGASVLLAIICFMGAGLSLFGQTAPAQGKVLVYPRPAGIRASADYEVRAGGKEVFTCQEPVFSMANFGVAGEADVDIKVRRAIKHAVVRPLSRGLKPSVEGDTVRVHLPGPCYVVLEVDEDLHRPLFLFANAIDAKAPKAGDPGVRYFEGGKVHDAGTIVLKDNETVYLAGGAVVRGLIRGKNISGARIVGPGILDATQRTTQAKLIDLERCRQITIDGIVTLGSYGWCIVPRVSEDVRVQHVKVLGWRDNDDGCDPDSSRRLTITNCFFRTKDDCIAVKTHDYSGAKEGAKMASPAYNTEDVRVENSVFWSSEWGHALTVGFAVRAPQIRNVVFAHCDIIKKEKGPAMSIDNHDLGAVENVRFEDIRVEDGCDRLLALKVAFSEYSADCPFEYYRNNSARKKATGAEWERIKEEKRSTTRGTVRQLLFKDIQISGDRLPGSDIVGFSSRNEISDVVFENILFQGKKLASPQEANMRIQNAVKVRFEK